MHGDGGHIRSCRHGIHRHIGSKVEMGAMSFVHQTQHIMGMSQLDNGAQIRANAIISGIVHQHGLGIRIGLNGLLHLG